MLGNSPYRDEQLDRLDIPAGQSRSRAAGRSLANPARDLHREGEPHVRSGARRSRKGNGDPSLTLFGEKSSPNHHKLAREFVLFDNFYVNADVSADGHNWSTAAIAPDYVQKMWPNSYARPAQALRLRRREPAALRPPAISGPMPLPPGITHAQLRLVGDESRQGRRRASRRSQRVRDPLLAKVTNMNYRGFDLDYPDVDRAKVFLADLQEFEKTGDDAAADVHAARQRSHLGYRRRARSRRFPRWPTTTTRSGMIVEAFRRASSGRRPRSSFSKTMRRTGRIMSIRTALRPLSSRRIHGGRLHRQHDVQHDFDAAHHGVDPGPASDDAFRRGRASDVERFHRQARHAALYAAEAARSRSTNESRQLSRHRRPSARLDFSEADEIDDDELNDILWRAIRKSEPPAPVRSYFSR